MKTPTNETERVLRRPKRRCLRDLRALGKEIKSNAAYGLSLAVCSINDELAKLKKGRRGR